LVRNKLEYETPRHQEVWERISKGEITSYYGNACKEFEEKREEGQKGKLAVV